MPITSTSTNTSRLIAPFVLVATIALTAALSDTGGEARPAGRIALDRWSENAALDWQTLDSLMARIPLTDGGQLVIDARTAVALGQGAAGIKHPLTADVRERIRFLLQQGLPPAAGTHVSDLFFQYIQYQEVRHHAAHTMSLAELEHLQTTVFGQATARALFHQQNAMQQALGTGNEGDGYSRKDKERH